MSVAVGRDLRLGMSGARDQGTRPTCCAFACSDVHAARRRPWAELSCEYAFFHGTKRQGTGPDTGVHLRHMLDAIEQEGQPLEAAWPYLPAVPSTPAAWAPPQDPGELFRARGVRRGGSLTEIRAAIDAGEPTVVILSLSDAFYFGADSDGVIDSNENPDVTRVHAVMAVGYGTRGSASVVLIRNSWGTGWGVAGHAWLTGRYLAPRIIEIATMAEVT